MTASDCAKYLTETIHGNSFCALAYVIMLLQGDKLLYSKFLEDCKFQGIKINEIYILSENANKNRIQVAGVLHSIEAVLRLKISISDILYYYYRLLNDTQL